MRLLFTVDSWYIPNSDKENVVKSWLFDKFFSYSYNLLKFEEPFGNKKVYCELVKTGTIIKEYHWVDKVWVDLEVREIPKDDWEIEWKEEFGVYPNTIPPLTGDEIHDLIKDVCYGGNYKWRISYDESCTATIDLDSIIK